MTVYFTPDADDALAELHTREDAASGALAASIDRWLDLLEQDPGSSAVRHRRFSTGLWAITIRDQPDFGWVILWDTDGTDIDVRYIGPASFA